MGNAVFKKNLFFSFLAKEDILEPKFFFLVVCENQFIKIFGDYELSKQSIAIIVVILDIINMSLMLTFINVMMFMQKDFVKHFDK